ncbi:cytochrome c [Pseudomonas sp.]|uniref:c-type cytochrome n=1 Tax=Pseudomonas sp. TaxID=306 RepID=UPI002355EA70|nr:cytochrome c [Pseudomonas sp.]
MNKIAKSLVAGLTLTAIAGTALAQVIGKTEDQIRWRQSAYHTMAWSMGRIKANVEGTYNKDQVVEAANVIQAIANSKMGYLYQPGSDKGKGWKETRLKSAFFTDKETLGKVAGNFGQQANDMAKVAAGGDAAAVKAQFGKLGEACKGCHDKFREEE